MAIFSTSRMGRYVLRHVLFGYGATLGLILLAILLVDVVEQLRTVGSRVDITVFDALGLTLLKTPGLIEETFPFVVLFGTIIGFTQINRRGELAAMRAAGVSAWRFTSPALGLAALVGLITAAGINPLAIEMNAAFEKQRAAYLRPQSKAETDTTIGRDIVWLKQGDRATQSIIMGRGTGKQSSVLTDVTFFHYERAKDGRLAFARRLDAKTAELRKGEWVLSDLTDNAPGRAPARAAGATMPTTLAADTLLNRFAASDSLSLWTLPEAIRTTREAGFAATRFSFRFHKLIAKPIYFMAMAAIAFALCLRLPRLGGVAQRAAIGVALGLGLFFFVSLGTAFAYAEAVPSYIGAWVPPLAALSAALAALSFQEDG